MKLSLMDDGPPKSSSVNPVPKVSSAAAFIVSAWLQMSL